MQVGIDLCRLRLMATSTWWLWLTISASGQKPLPCPTRVLPCFSLSCFVGEKFNAYTCAHSTLVFVHSIHVHIMIYYACSTLHCILISSSMYTSVLTGLDSVKWWFLIRAVNLWIRWRRSSLVPLNSTSHCNSTSLSNKWSHREIQPDSAVSTGIITSQHSEGYKV